MRFLFNAFASSRDPCNFLLIPFIRLIPLPLGYLRIKIQFPRVSNSQKDKAAGTAIIQGNKKRKKKKEIAGMNVNNTKRSYVEMVPSADTFSNKKAEPRTKGGSKAFKGRSLSRPQPPRFRRSHPRRVCLTRPPFSPACDCSGFHRGKKSRPPHLEKPSLDVQHTRILLQPLSRIQPRTVNKNRSARPSCSV